MKKLNWGIIGTGSIAKAFARGLQQSSTGCLLAIGSRAQESAERFGDEFSIARRYATYEALLADPEIEAVYIATPHPAHAEWSIRSTQAGKRVLCEKPATLNYGDTMTVIEAARRAGVFWMEAFMYRCHPQTQRLVELIRDGAIGDVRVIQATFSFRASSDPRGRLLNRELGGGGILDIGCYPVSIARLVAGVAVGRPFEEPLQVLGAGHKGSATGVDEWAAAVLTFPGEILAQVSAGVQVAQDNTVRIYGSDGWIHLPAPWQPAKLGGEWSFLLHRSGVGEPEVVSGFEPRSLYAVEADYVAAHLEAREAVSPGMSWADTLGNMRVLDAWREQIGVVYEQERAENNPPRLLPRPPASPAVAPITKGRIPGVSREVARLVMGVDNQRGYSHAAAMFDDYMDKGGNAFDTAYVYGNGRQERLLGAWVRNRGVRDDVVIIGKGAHTPCCDPLNLTRQLHETLERLQTDHVDAGLVRVFGGSNWTIARFEEANRYAARKGLRGFTVLSNNLSLARMVQPPWADCISASDPVSRAWLERHQVPILAWSSQARGFFTDRAGPEKQDDPELVRCWYSPDNFHRRERAIELARVRGVQPINIALAYVLHLPFPTFTLIGPRNLDETRTSLPALNVHLSPEDMRYLNLEEAKAVR